MYQQMTIVGNLGQRSGNALHRQRCASDEL